MAFCECGNRPEKSIQNRPKMMPGRCLGDTRGLPGASGGSVRAVFQTQLKIYGKLKVSGRLPGHPRRPPGTQRDPQNHVKIDFLVKKGISNLDSSSFFLHEAVFNGFRTISLRFFAKNQRKNDEKRDVPFHRIACFFEHGDLHETSYFTIRNILFAFFVFLCFS